MFVIPSPNVIESDDGFAVEVIGPSSVEYREGERRLSIDSEYLAGPHGLAIHRGSIKAWQPPHALQPIDELQRDVIVDRVQAAFRFQGIEIEVL